MNGHSADLPSAHAAAPAAAMPLRAVLAVALAAGYVALVAWSYRDYAMDDAYIGFRYIANFLAGGGFAFAPGARVEGVTNIGWLLLLALPSMLVAPPVAAKLAAALLFGLTLWLVFAIARRAAGGLLPGVAVILAAASADFAAFSMLGMETALLAALLAGMVWLSLDRPNWPVLAALGAFACLVHPEAVLVLPLALGIAMTSRTIARRDAAHCLLIFAALVALATAARWAYFGAPVPNTFLAKPGGAMDFVVHALVYATGGFANLSQPFTSPLPLAAAGIGYAALRHKAPLAAAMALACVLTGFLFSLYAGPDWTKQGRYFAAYAPLALLLLAAGVLEIARRLSADARAMPTAAAALVVLVALPGAFQTFHLISPASRQDYPGYVLTGDALVEPALWMRDNLPADATIATRRVGALGYFGERRIFDYTFGLNDRDVAALIRARGRAFDDPNHPDLAALWVARAPDYLLEDGPVIDRIAGGSRGSFRVHGMEYRVVKTFPLGGKAEWVLAQRVTPARATP